MPHVILLGDSIFDNAVYVAANSAVIDHCRARFPANWRATLLARDGAVCSGVVEQLAQLPADATHFVVSVGGNDALRNRDLVSSDELLAYEAFAHIADVQDRFRRHYRDMIQELLARKRPILLCTVYDSVPDLARRDATGLSVFNDVILSEAIRERLPVLDLRQICDEAQDYSSVSPIEPSAFGGYKIVQALIRVLTTHDFSQEQTWVYGK